MINNASTIDYQLQNIKISSNSNITTIKLIEPFMNTTINLDSIIITNSTNQTLYQVKLTKNNKLISQYPLLRPKETITIESTFDKQTILEYHFLKNNQWNTIYIFKPLFQNNIKRITHM